MSFVKYHPLVCTSCGKHFEDKEEVVTIAARTFDKSNFLLRDLTKTEYTSDFKDPMFDVFIEICPREKNFHLNCFEEIAGKDFIP